MSIDSVQFREIIACDDPRTGGPIENLRSAAIDAAEEIDLLRTTLRAARYYVEHVAIEARRTARHDPEFPDDNPAADVLQLIDTVLKP